MSPSATLSASDVQAGDGTGFSVSADRTGDTVAAGAPCSLSVGTLACGSVYVFVKPSMGWASANQTAKLTVAAGAGVVNNLGYSVALSAAGDLIATGATNNFSSNPGAVYVFNRPASGWADASTAAAKLLASDGATGAQLGAAVSMSSDGGTIAVGAPVSVYPDATTNENGPGAAYIFLRPSGGWNSATPQNENAKLTASDRLPNDFFAASGCVSISGDGNTVVAGASGHPYVFATHTAGPGAAYVFNKPSSGWQDRKPSQESWRPSPDRTSTAWP